MNCFLDSNVVLGYIFTLDNIHHVTKNLVFKEGHSFCSINVTNEIEKVYWEKTCEYNEFLLKLKRILKKYGDNNLINEYDVHKKINTIQPIGKLKNKDMHLIVSILWETLNFDENHDSFDVKLRFNFFKMDFFKSNNVRKDKIFNKLILVPNHTKKDKVILNMVKKEKLNKLLHDEDEDILFDANEFCILNQELNLKFVSADQDLLNVFDILKSYLCIKESINVLYIRNS